MKTNKGLIQNKQLKLNCLENVLDKTHFFFLFSIQLVPFQGLPEQITVFQFNLFSVSSTLTPTTCISSLKYMSSSNHKHRFAGRIS